MGWAAPASGLALSGSPGRSQAGCGENSNEKRSGSQAAARDPAALATSVVFAWLGSPPDQLITGWAGQSCNATTPGTPRARREPPGHRSPDRQAPRPRRRGHNPDVQTSQRDGLPHVDPGFRGEPFGPCYVSRGPLHMAQPVADSGRISGASTRGPNPVRRERTMPLAGPTRTNGEARAGLGPRPRRPSRGEGGLAHAAGSIASFR